MVVQADQLSLLVIVPFNSSSSNELTITEVRCTSIKVANQL